MKRIVRRHRDADVPLRFEDEARVGQKGRNTRVWSQRGLRPFAPTDKRSKSVSVYGAVRPATDDAFGLVPLHADTAMMSLFLDAFTASHAPNVHAILVMDKAGRHVTGRLKVPPNVSLMRLTPYSPELNRVERVWLPLKDRYLCHRIFADVHAIVDACARAWNDLLTDKDRVASLTAYPYLKQVRTS